MEENRKCAWYHSINKAVKIVVITIIINLILLAGLIFAIIYFIAAGKACIYANPNRKDANT